MEREPIVFERKPHVRITVTDADYDPVNASYVVLDGVTRRINFLWLYEQCLSFSARSGSTQGVRLRLPS